ncbi:hypothetical protein [Duganella sp. LjRoot269]|jgi:hypothetical protein|uniref:hypothetical protein n=1 Tax=Duganella sp. LjRoot269 TaxID=3342305 RepID=UPI0017B3BE0A
MESRTPSPRNLYLAGAVAGALLLGAAAYFASVTPAESQVMPASAKVPASASASASASVKAVVAPRAPAAANVAPVVPAEPQHLRSKEQAASALMALPELQAWSAIVEKNSGGKSHGALIEYDPAPRKLNGKNYWQFSFVENSAEAAQRWESFLVSSSDEEILVEDASTDEVISLARWRREKHPAKRTSIDN